MKFSILIALLCTLLFTRSAEVNKSLLKVEEVGSGDPLIISVIEKGDGDTPDDTEWSGDDAVDAEESGSGSGSGGDPIIVKVNTTATVSPTFKIDTSRLQTTQRVVVINDRDGSTTVTTSTDKATTKKKVDEGFTSLVTTMGNSVEDERWGNIVKNTTGNDIIVIQTDKSTGDNNDSGNSDVENSGVNFTVAIIVGVVVGAILSILIIVFLVYRLRKKDEGSYSLDEPSSAMLRADTDSPPPKGKEEYYA